MQNRDHARKITSLGFFLLIGGIVLLEFVHLRPGVPAKLSHALGGLFLGLAIPVMLRGIWLKKHPKGESRGAS
jgi:hypothetical protein